MLNKRSSGLICSPEWYFQKKVDTPAIGLQKIIGNWNAQLDRVVKVFHKSNLFHIFPEFPPALKSQCTEACSIQSNITLFSLSNHQEWYFHKQWVTIFILCIILIFFKTKYMLMKCPKIPQMSSKHVTLWCHTDDLVSTWFQVQAVLDISFHIGTGSRYRNSDFKRL